MQFSWDLPAFTSVFHSCAEPDGFPALLPVRSCLQGPFPGDIRGWDAFPTPALCRASASQDNWRNPGCSLAPISMCTGIQMELGVSGSPALLCLQLQAEPEAG